MSIKLNRSPEDLSEEVLMAYLQNFLDISDFRKIQNGKQMLQLIRKHSDHPRIKVAIRKVVGLFHCDVPAAKVCALQFLKEGLETGSWTIVQGIQKSMLNVFAEVIQYRSNIRDIQRGTTYFIQNINKNTTDDFIMNLIKLSSTYFRMIHECLYVWGALYFPGSSYDKLRIKLQKKYQFPKWPQQFKFFSPRKIQFFKSNCTFLIQKMAAKVSNFLQTNSINSKNSSKSLNKQQNIKSSQKIGNYSPQKIKQIVIENNKKIVKCQINNKNNNKEQNDHIKGVKSSRNRLQRKKIYDQKQDQTQKQSNQLRFGRKEYEIKDINLKTIKQVHEEANPAHKSKNPILYKKQNSQNIYNPHRASAPKVDNFNKSFKNISENEDSDDAGGRYSPAETSQISKQVDVYDNVRKGINSPKSYNSQQNIYLKQIKDKQILSQRIITHKIQQTKQKNNIKNNPGNNSHTTSNFQQISIEETKNKRNKKSQNKDEIIPKKKQTLVQKQISQSQQQKTACDKIKQKQAKQNTSKATINTTIPIKQIKNSLHANHKNKQTVEQSDLQIKLINMTKNHYNSQKKIKPQKIKKLQTTKTVFENIPQLKINANSQKEQITNKRQINDISQNNFNKHSQIQKSNSNDVQNGLKQQKQQHLKKLNQRQKYSNLQKNNTQKNQLIQSNNNKTDIYKINRQIDISNSNEKKPLFNKNQKQAIKDQKYTIQYIKNQIGDQIHQKSSLQQQKQNISYTSPIRTIQKAPPIFQSQLNNQNIQSIKSTVKQQIIEEFTNFKSAILNNQNQKLNQSIGEIKSQILKQFKLGTKDVKININQCSTQTFRYKSKNKFDRKQIYKQKAQRDEGNCLVQNIPKQQYDDSLIYKKSKISSQNNQNFMNISNNMETRLSKKLSLQKRIDEQLKPNTLLYALYRRKSFNL